MAQPKWERADAQKFLADWNRPVSRTITSSYCLDVCGVGWPMATYRMYRPVGAKLEVLDLGMFVKCLYLRRKPLRRAKAVRWNR